METERKKDRRLEGWGTAFPKSLKQRISGYRLSVIFIAILAFSLFAGTLSGEFVWDDEHIIQHTRQVVKENGPGGLLAAPFMKFYADRPESRQYYRPVVLASMWANYPQGSPSPFFYHLFNVLLHTANSLLVFVLFNWILHDKVGAIIGSLIFAVHPVHAESVSWISGRTDMLAAFFILLTVITWYRTRSDQNLRVSTPLLLSLLFYSLACLAKEIAFLFPVIAVFWALSDRPAHDRSLKAVIARDGKWILGWLAVTALWLFVRADFLGQQGSLNLYSSLPLSASAMLALFIKVAGNISFYLRLLFFPWPLAVYYSPSTPRITLMVVVVTLIFSALCLCLSGRRHGRIGLLVLSWVLIFLFPVTGVVDLGLSPLAERFCYLPSVGAAMLMGYLLGRAWSRVSDRKALIIAVTALTVLLGTGSVMHSRRWADEITLFNQAVKDNRVKVPNIYFNLGTAYLKAGKYLEATESFEEAILLHPSYVNAMYNLASSFIALGEHERSYEIITRAEALAPEDPRISSIKGVVLELLGQNEKALEAYSRAGELDPHDPEAGYHMGNLLLRLERFDESAVAFEKALSANPYHSGAVMGLGRSMENMGSLDTATQIYLKAIEVYPEKAALYTALGGVLLKQERPREAVVVYRMAHQLAPSDPEINRGIVASAISADDIGLARKHIDLLREIDPDLSRELMDLHHEKVDPANGKQGAKATHQ